MRAFEFLLEYRRDITVNRFRDPLFKKIVHEYPHELDRFKDLDQQKSDATLADTLDTYIEYIERKDPSPNKQYVEWMTRMWITDPRQKLEDLNRGDLLGKYHRGKNVPGVVPPEMRDIGRFKTYRDFENAMMDDSSGSSVGSRYLDHFQNEKKKLTRGQSKEVYSDETVRVIVPEDEPAACYYGQGTRWCTAATQGNNLFDRYNSQGPLYILLPAQPAHKGEKYQLHFPSGQFMDEGDEEIDVANLLNEFPGFKRYLQTHEPKLKEYLVLADHDDIEEISDYVKGRILNHIESIMNAAKGSDDFYEWQLERASDLGLVDQKGDPDWGRIASEPELQFSEYDSDAAEFAREMVNEIQSATPETIIDVAAEIQQDGNGMVPLDYTGMREVYSHIIDNIENYSYKDTATVDKLMNVPSWIINTPNGLWSPKGLRS